MRVSIIGAGYVGLVSGACLADKGHDVVCVDVSQAKVDRINQGQPPIHETGLPELLKANVGKKLRATVDVRRAVLDSELSLIAVGTPFDGREIDLTHVREASRQIGQALREKSSYHVVVVKSTVVPGTTEEVVLPELESASGKRAGVDFGVGMNPEFLREGEAIADFMSPDRIVLGGIDRRTMDHLQRLYSMFEGVDRVCTTPRTAEMIKYTANSLLATMISFSNEIGNLCATVGDVDVVEVMKAVHLDRRLRPVLPSGERITPGFTAYLEAGCGFGGSCFPKDVKALTAYGAKGGLRMQLLEAVMGVNTLQPQRVVDLLRGHFSSLDGVKVSVLGLAFKAGTDDMRESPAIPVVHTLCRERGNVSAYDPVARSEAERVFAGLPVTYCESLSAAIEGAQAIVIMTRWPEFKDLPKVIAGRQPAPVVIDARRMLDKHDVSAYEGIGLRRIARGLALLALALSDGFVAPSPRAEPTAHGAEPITVGMRGHVSWSSPMGSQGGRGVRFKRREYGVAQV